MKKIKFENASFFKSVADIAQLPAIKNSSGIPIPEIVIAGRSNAGKSSLINHLLRNKKLARTSSTPGKTQLLNFFLIENDLFLVDLPGYGYAKVSQAIKEQWTKSLASYFEERSNLGLILLLLDIRRDPCEEDLALFSWARHYSKPLFVIFTKCDKVSQSEKLQNTKHILNELASQSASTDIPHAHFSIFDQKARTVLIEAINKELEHL